MTPRHDIAIADIKAMLNERWDSLVEELLPYGTLVRRAAWYEIGSLDGERGQSLKLYRGTRAGAWIDYAGGQDDRGDALGLIERLVTGGDIVAAIKWAKGWLGLEDVDPQMLARRQQQARRANVERQRKAEREAAEKREKAKGIWLNGVREIKGTPADMYLKGRSINLARLGRQPGALRFNPACYERETNSNLPAMVACVTGPDGFLAVHRTYLAERAGHWVKADLSREKTVYGAYPGGSIPLWRGASGKPLKQAPEGDRIALTEGIEDGLSMAIIDPSLRVHAAVSVSNLAGVWLPDSIREVILCRQNDDGNPQAIAAFDKAIESHADQGRRVRDFRTPPAYGKDPNDWLRALEQAEQIA